jgi:hypothetical protein
MIDPVIVVILGTLKCSVKYKVKAPAVSAATPKRGYFCDFEPIVLRFSILRIKFLQQWQITVKESKHFLKAPSSFGIQHQPRWQRFLSNTTSVDI